MVAPASQLDNAGRAWPDRKRQAVEGGLVLDRERGLERYLEFLEASLSEAAVREVQLTESGQIRDLVGQAKGILMEREGATADQALELLTSCARNLNLKLREVAALVVADTASNNRQAPSETA